MVCKLKDEETGTNRREYLAGRHGGKWRSESSTTLSLGQINPDGVMPGQYLCNTMDQTLIQVNIKS